MKAKKCSYKYCKQPENFDPSTAIKDKKCYYHLECYEKKQAKNTVFNLFCDYVTNDESGMLIRSVISKWIDKEGVSLNYLLFTMKFIIQNKIPLKSIFGLGLVMKQQRVINAYNKCLAKYQTPNIEAKTQDFNFEKNNQGGWRDLIG